eukprot:m.473379 g.473379  ORF g.473379 m.473379 type:complete len:330 (+) comp57121_c0_seq1:1547-2536(+)
MKYLAKLLVDRTAVTHVHRTTCLDRSIWIWWMRVVVSAVFCCLQLRPLVEGMVKIRQVPSKRPCIRLEGLLVLRQSPRRQDWGRRAALKAIRVALPGPPRLFLPVYREAGDGRGGQGHGRAFRALRGCFIARIRRAGACRQVLVRTRQVVGGSWQTQKRDSRLLVIPRARDWSSDEIIRGTRCRQSFHRRIHHWVVLRVPPLAIDVAPRLVDEDALGNVKIEGRRELALHEGSEVRPRNGQLVESLTNLPVFLPFQADENAGKVDQEGSDFVHRGDVSMNEAQHPCNQCRHAVPRALGERKVDLKAGGHGILQFRLHAWVVQLVASGEQ